MNPNAIIKNYSEAKTQEGRNFLANMLIRKIISNPVCNHWKFELPNYSEEKWAAIEGFEGLYEISNLGRLKRLISGRPIISSFYSKGGNYLHTNLRLNRISHRASIHIEVAKAFVPNPENKPYVNHLDGYKDNPRWDNLEWSTIQENNNHARETGLNNSKGEGSSNSKLTNEDVIYIVSSSLSNKELAEMFCIKASTISGIRRGKAWVHLTGVKKIRKKLAPEVALAIFNSNLPYPQISEKYKTTIGNVNAIKAGVSWGHITGKNKSPYIKKCNLAKN